MRPRVKQLEVLGPTRDATKEEVGGGIDGLERKALRDGERHQLVVTLAGRNQRAANAPPKSTQSPVRCSPTASMRLRIRSFERAGSTTESMVPFGFVDEAWEILERAGVPCGALRMEKPELSDLGKVADAAREALAHVEQLDERQRVSLLAWLNAWATSFPTSFREAFTLDGAEVLARAADRAHDVGRYIKLRRIARDVLLRVL
jgi:hypothetical protein